MLIKRFKNRFGFTWIVSTTSSHAKPKLSLNGFSKPLFVIERICEVHYTHFYLDFSRKELGSNHFFLNILVQSNVTVKRLTENSNFVSLQLRPIASMKVLQEET